MTPFELHSSFFNQPIRLDAEEKAAPLEVLQDFYQNCPLSSLRKTLKELTEAALALPDSSFDDANERRYALWLYHQLEKALEAGWLLVHEKAVASGNTET